MTVAMDRVLLLNGDYRPLGTLSIPRAVNLLMGERAYSASEQDVVRKLKTPNTVFEVPSVLVLKRYINVPHRTKKWSRRGVLDRDNYTCVFCGRGAYTDNIDKSEFTIDHILPRSRGGKSNWVNTACACYDCNHLKGDKKMSEVGFKLRWQPKTPRTNYWVASGNVPVAWKKWLNI